MLLFIVPVKGEWMGVSIDGVRHRDHLVQIRWQAGEFGQIGLGHRTGWLAAMEIGAGGIVVQ